MRALLSRAVAPIGALLKQGVEPRSLAWAVAVGVVLGVFPVLGTTTVLCTIAAVGLRLNLVALHAVHYAMTPLQLALIIPFVRLGEHITGALPQPLSLSEGQALIAQGIGHAVFVLWDAIVHAAVGWLIVAPLAIAFIYGASAWCLIRARRLSRTEALGSQPPPSSAASRR